MDLFYPGAVKDLYQGGDFTGGPWKVVLHTTEGTKFPSYGSKLAGVNPTFTVMGNFATKRVEVRQHLPLNKSGRALVDISSSPVRSNRDSAIQIEIVGTCDDAKKGKKGWVGWHVTEWPDWYLQGIADLLGWIEKQVHFKRVAPAFLPYPKSYGNSKVRLTARAWDTFNGVCGHQHVPEGNSHGDPGAIPVKRLFDLMPQPGHALKKKPKIKGKVARKPIIKRKPVISLKNVKAHSKNADVKALQIALRNYKQGKYLRLNPSGVSGFFGAETGALVKAVKRDMGLDANSYAGTRLLKNLGFNVKA